MWYDVSMEIKIPVSILVLSAIVIAAVVNITSPSDMGPFGILLFFASAYGFFMGLFYVLLFFLKRVTLRLNISPAKKAGIETVTSLRLYYYSTVIALFPVIYIGMQSMGSVGIFEMALLVLFEILACFFVYKRY